ncbi:hypothetical protein [Chroococcidiopsis cubana]|nr:hypothetical protein [Chroococcidiopsis cubana]
MKLRSGGGGIALSEAETRVILNSQEILELSNERVKLKCLFMAPVAH